MSNTDPTLNAPKPRLDFEDSAVRDELREMSQIATQPGVLFGRDFDFTPERRELAQGVVNAAREKLQPPIEANKDEWDKLHDLLKKVVIKVQY